jgi:hypothetical protein
MSDLFYEEDLMAHKARVKALDEMRITIEGVDFWMVCYEPEGGWSERKGCFSLGLPEMMLTFAHIHEDGEPCMVSHELKQIDVGIVVKRIAGLAERDGVVFIIACDTQQQLSEAMKHMRRTKLKRCTRERYEFLRLCSGLSNVWGDRLQ